MNNSLQAQTPFRAPRFTGLGIAALVHLVLLAGLLQGLVKAPSKAPPGPTQVELLQQKPPPPVPEPLPMPTQEPTLLRQLPPQVQIPVPIFFEERPPTGHEIQARSDSSPSNEAAVTAPPVPVAEPARPAAGLAQAGMVCTQMGRPELPALNWSGEAVLKIVATVRAGRVVASELVAARGSPDARTRRQLLAAVDTALRESYVCPGDHRFEQEFAFRVD